jgi:hypothetical protein
VCEGGEWSDYGGILLYKLKGGGGLKEWRVVFLLLREENNDGEMVYIFYNEGGMCV